VSAPYGAGPPPASHSPQHAAYQPPAGYSQAEPGYSQAEPASGSPAEPGHGAAQPWSYPAAPGYPHAAPAPAHPQAASGYPRAAQSYPQTAPGYSQAAPSHSPATPGYPPAIPGYPPATPGYPQAASGYSQAAQSYPQAAPGYAPALPETQCRLCGCVPAADVTFRGHRGMLVLMQFLHMRGPFCRDCGLATFRDMTAKTLIQGWYGYASSVITPITVLINLARRGKVASLPPPRPPAQGPHRRPLDPGPALFARPIAVLGLFVPVLLVMLVVGYVAVRAATA
jgi:hypothetical protein